MRTELSAIADMLRGAKDIAVYARSMPRAKGRCRCVIPLSPKSTFS